MSLDVGSMNSDVHVGICNLRTACLILRVFMQLLNIQHSPAEERMAPA